MDIKDGDGARHRRKPRREEEEKWECSVCTYINRKEAYKCEICFMRKGTSTRKPRPNPQVLEQQQLIAQAILKEKDEENRRRKSEKSSSRDRNVKLKNFDRSSPLLFEIFANGYSVVITEFPPKSKGRIPHFPESPAASNCSSLLGFSGTTSAIPDQLSPTDSSSTTDAAGRAFAFVDSELGEGLDSKPRLLARPPHPNSSKPVGLSNSRDQFGHSGRSHPVSTPSPLQPISQLSTSNRKRESSIIDTPGRVTEQSDLKRKSMRSNRTRRVPSRLTKTTFRSNVLSAKRPSGSDGMKLIISPRRKRILSDNTRLRTSTKSAKRGRPGISRTTIPKVNSRKRSTRVISRCSLHPTDTGYEEDISNRNPQSPASTRSSTPLYAQRVPAGKRYSSTPMDLKCKIHTDSRAALQTEIMSTSGTARLSSSLPTVSSDAVMDQSLPLVVPSRLSSESKNTSAMTDSAGATALEMSS